MYVAGDIPEPTAADELEFERWPESQQRLAERVLLGPRYGEYPKFGGSTIHRPVISPTS